MCACSVPSLEKCHNYVQLAVNWDTDPRTATVRKQTNKQTFAYIECYMPQVAVSIAGGKMEIVLVSNHHIDLLTSGRWLQLAKICLRGSEIKTLGFFIDGADWKK